MGRRTGPVELVEEHGDGEGEAGCGRGELGATVTVIAPLSARRRSTRAGDLRLGDTERSNNEATTRTMTVVGVVEVAGAQRSHVCVTDRAR